jgi:hypothetical protein
MHIGRDHHLLAGRERGGAGKPVGLEDGVGRHAEAARQVVDGLARLDRDLRAAGAHPAAFAVAGDGGRGLLRRDRRLLLGRSRTRRDGRLLHGDGRAHRLGRAGDGVVEGRAGDRRKRRPAADAVR